MSFPLNVLYVVWYVRWKWLSCNGYREYSDDLQRLLVQRRSVFCGGTKGACKHGCTPTIKSVMEVREKVLEVLCTLRVNSLHPRGITISGLCGVWLGARENTCSMIPTRRCAPVLHDAYKLACSSECVALRRRIIVHVQLCEWSRA